MPDARSIALDVLTHITTDRIEVDDALARTGFANLDARERSFAFTLVMACLRWGRAADRVLMQYMEILLPERKQYAKWAMRMGVIQLRVLATPDHAAVSETVELMKSSKGDKAYAGLTNAVLKRVAAERPKIEPVNAFPHWFESKWRETYGDVDFVAMADAMVEEPPIDITVPKESDHYLKALNAVRMSDMTLRLPAGTAGNDVVRLEGFRDGAWWVQDAAAALPVRLLGDVKGMQVLDLCAAPGGKTAQLCAGGAIVTSVDRSPSRIARLRENMGRLKMQPTIIDADIMKWEPEGTFDAIVLDAPCSATGTLRRHPEIGWIRNPREQGRLAYMQREMLERVWAWLKPGGKLVYAVCSLEPEEGEKQVEAFLEAHKDASAQRPAIAPGVIPPSAWTLQNTLRILPHYDTMHGGYDGFFAALLTKSA